MVKRLAIVLSVAFVVACGEATGDDEGSNEASNEDDLRECQTRTGNLAEDSRMEQMDDDDEFPTWGQYFRHDEPHTYVREDDAEIIAFEIQLDLEPTPKDDAYSTLAVSRTWEEELLYEYPLTDDGESVAYQGETVSVSPNCDDDDNECEREDPPHYYEPSDDVHLYFVEHARDHRGEDTDLETPTISVRAIVDACDA
ncbi:MAG: hypothetical protein ACOCV2_02265 [Persicimonas sp.]